MKHILYPALFAALLLFAGCRSHTHHEDGDITFMRLERVLGDTEAAGLGDAIAQFRTQFASPLLTLYPEDPAFMAMVEEYRNDSVTQALDSCVRRRYGSLDVLEHELTQALRRAADADDEITISHFATFIGDAGYDSRVRADRESGSLVVAIDRYVLRDMERYGYFGDPLYLVHLSDSQYIATDCMAAISHEYIAMPDTPPTLLDYMVSEGKELYFLDVTLPDTPDSIKIRYTREQYKWMEQSEEKVWAYLLQNNVLFESDFARFHNLIDEAPKTNCFGDSAPRTVEYIGWQIVRQYMKKSKATLKELFAETDSQKILSISCYHP